MVGLKQFTALSTGVDTIWIVLTAAMIILMEGGFALLEAGFVRRKNSVSIIMKVFVDIAFGTLCFYAIGFAFMYGKDWSSFIGTTGFGMKGDLSHLTFPFSKETFFMFQAAFVIAVISIVSGAVAERMQFRAYVLYAVVMTTVIYPISGHWVWGGGWLGRMGMLDFAGSAVIHAMGGFSALAAAQMIGPRLDKYKGSETHVIIPSNIPLASVGAFLLWFGWFGFNAGSTLSASDVRIGHIAMVTMLAASAGGAVTLLYTMFRYGRADAPSVINGSLAGLVGITAGCAFVSADAAILIGAVCGLAMLAATYLLDIWKIDDPVGAFPVHGVSGILGTLAVGLFATDKGVLYGGGWSLLGVQALGLLVICVWGYAMTWIALKGISWLVPLRVTEEEERIGLDISAHGTMAVNDKDTLALGERFRSR
ncbi:ammonium transporter [Aneurinibacillus uraniidurans]|uniref:ammonium transporter n=1 Tax=Aneurinibacillus uraniidurans TaxID=2966586 RepID=UPI00234A47D1|nr:ammonium transporter [Aneurinibacillus sp. B1]WCN38828.1 ammonium transporter [Aneurinibacillus sp. B1]